MCKTLFEITLLRTSEDFDCNKFSRVPIENLPKFSIIFNNFKLLMHLFKCSLLDRSTTETQLKFSFRIEIKKTLIY